MLLTANSGCSSQWIHPPTGSLSGTSSAVSRVRLADVEAARTQWVGKTLWLATPDLQAAPTGSGELRAVKVNRLAPVEVTEIQLGWTSDAPIRFVVRTAVNQTRGHGSKVSFLSNADETREAAHYDR